MELVGRTSELGQVVAAVKRHPAVVQIVGPPGSGVSALATAAAHALGVPRVLRFDDAHTPEGVERVLSRAKIGHSFEDLLNASAETVWVLDGVFGVLPLLREVLSSITGTSAPTLLVAGGARLPFGEVVHLGPLARDAATSLYLATARRARGESSPDDAPAVVRAVLGYLDGLPGAIVAAAERAALLGGKRLAERLATDPSTLAGTSLHASFERVCAALPMKESRALRALSVLDGRFSADVAEAIVGTPSALADVQALRELGLVDATTAHGERKLALPRPLRDYLRYAFHDDGDGARARAEEHLARIVLDHAEPHEGPRGRVAPADAITALGALVTMSNLEGAARVASQLDAQSPAALATETGVRALDRLVGELENEDRAVATSVTLVARARAHQTRGRLDLATADLTRAKSLAKRAGDPHAQGLADQRLASIRTDGGDPRAGKKLAERAFELLDGVSPRDAAAALSTLGTAEMALGESMDAREHFVRALALREQAHDDEGAAQEHAGIGATLYQEGRLAESVRSYDRAKELLQASPRGDLFGYVLAARALALQELGHFPEAEADLARATEVLLEHESLRFRRVFLGYLAQLRHESKRATEAERTYREAISELREARHVVYADLFRASLGALLAELGRITEAEALFDDTADEGAPVPTTLARRIHRGHVALHYARTARAAGTPFEAHVERAKAALGLAREASSDDDVRFAERLLARAISAFDSGGSAQEVLTIGKDVGSFRVGPRAPVDLRRKRATRLMLKALVEARVQRPGEPIVVDALVKATWPGERILPQAALSRVYVTVLMLRNLGLRTILVQRDGGYLLDPNVRLVDEGAG